MQHMHVLLHLFRPRPSQLDLAVGAWDSLDLHTTSLQFASRTCLPTVLRYSFTILVGVATISCSTGGNPPQGSQGWWKSTTSRDPMVEIHRKGGVNPYSLYSTGALYTLCTLPVLSIMGMYSISLLCRSICFSAGTTCTLYTLYRCSLYRKGGGNPPQVVIHRWKSTARVARVVEIHRKS